jgi:uncharacterized protein (TIGR02001 family)
MDARNISNSSSPTGRAYTEEAMHRLNALLPRRIASTPTGRLVAALILVIFAWAVGPRGVRAAESWSATLGATTDYIYRGISQTYGGSALQLGANYQHADGWFAGVWGSNVDPYPGGASSKELDLYTGINHELGDDFVVRGTYTHYAYLRDPRPSHYDHDEIAVGVTYVDLLAATISYQPNSSAYTDLGFAHKRATLAYEATGRWPLRAGLWVSASGGYYDLHDLFHVGYWAGDAGIAYGYRRLTLDLRRFFCDATAARLYEDASANGVWAFSAVVRF